MTGAGALGGAFWGMLFGLIFFVPLLGMAIGAGMGALTGSMTDVGIDDAFIRRMRDEIQPGTSALFLLTSGAVVDKVQDGLRGPGHRAGREQPDRRAGGPAAGGLRRGRGAGRPAHVLIARIASGPGRRRSVRPRGRCARVSVPAGRRPGGPCRSRGDASMTVEPSVGVGLRVEAAAGPLPALGVAEEFLLLRPDGDAASVAPEVLGTVAHELRVRPGATGFQVESIGSTGGGLAALARELSVARRALAEAAADQGARLVSLGTPPFTAPDPAAGSAPRSGRLFAVVPDGTGAEATCGFRVRVRVPSRELGVAVLGRVRGWLPLLLALTGNSPLWRGRDTGWSSYRYVVQGRRQPASSRCLRRCRGPGAAETADGPGPVASRSEVAAHSVASWSRLAPGSPAVEVRIADTCSTVADAVLLSGLVRGLTAVALLDEVAGREAPVVPERVVAASARAAARWGMRSSLADPRSGRHAPAGELLAALVDSVAPALAAADELAVVTAALRGRLRRGSGADRQRTLHRAGDRQALVQTLANICAGVDH